MTREDILTEALKWEGVKWQHQGRSVRGIDCAGLPIMVGLTLGLTTANPRSYPRRPDGTFLKYFQDNLDQIAVADLQIGDIAIFSGTNHNHVCHCGIVGVKYGQPSVVHAHAQRRKVIHERLSEALTVVGRPVHAFSYPGIS